MKRLAKRVLQRFLFPQQICEGGSEIDPVERNKKETLDLLWGDEEFKSRYLSSHRKELYNGVLRIAEQNSIELSGSNLLDVGCGPGFFLKHLCDANPKASLNGCDFSDAAIESAKICCPVANCFVHDIFQPLQQKYDVVFCMEVLEHLTYPAAALHQISKSTSTLLLTVPEGRKDTFRGHINFWSKQSFETFLELALPEFEFTVVEFNDSRNLAGVASRADSC